MTDSLSNNQGDTKPQVDPAKDYVPELVGDGKKFKTVQDLARGKFEADLHIQQIEAERALERAEYQRLRDDYNSRAKLEELMDQFTQKQLASSNQNLNANEDTKPTLDPKQIEDIFENKYRQTKANELAQQNFDRVRDKLIELKGDAFPSFIKQQRESLGLSAEDVDALARKSPNAFFNTFGLNPTSKETFQAPPPSSHSFRPQGAPARTWTYYENMRKTEKALYNSPKIQEQMIQDAMELGDRFQDGNYHQLPV